MRIDDLLARDGLPATLRLLVLVIVSIWRADWETLRDAAHRCRALGAPRSDLEETLLQAVLFCGFPRVVTAFEHLERAWPAPAPPRGGALPAAEQPAAGRAVFATIYGKNTDSVHAMLQACHQDFHDFVLEAAYGRVLSRPALSGRTRELLAVGALAAQDQLRQFVGHARGALHFGSNRQELREVLVTVYGDTPQVDDWLHRVR